MTHARRTLFKDSEGKMTLKCAGVSLDTALKALADRRGRLILQYLRETSNGVATTEELTRHVREHTSSGKERENVEASLHHVYLPKLEKADFINYDSRSNTVRYQPPSKIKGLIDCIESVSRE